MTKKLYKNDKFIRLDPPYSFIEVIKQTPANLIYFRYEDLGNDENYVLHFNDFLKYFSKVG